MILRLVKGLFLAICVVIIAVLIYVHFPRIYEVRYSPFGNARIETIYPKRSFWLFSFQDSHYKIIYKGKKIAKVNRYCYECLIHEIIDVKWYRDSSVVTYETSYEGRDTINVTYNFLK